MSDWTPSQQTQQEIQLFVQSLLERLPVLLGIDEAIAGCEVTNTDPYSTGAVPRYIKVRINDYLQDVYYRGQPQNLVVGDFVSVLHYRQGNIYEVFGSSGTTGSTLTWKLVSPDGTIDPVIAADNSGNLTALDAVMLIGNDATLADFPEARLIVSQDDSEHTYTDNIAIVGEAACDGANPAVGIGGVAKVVGAKRARGVAGRGLVDDSADTGTAIGVHGLSNAVHAGGTNVAIGATATNGANNYSFYGEAGKIYNADDIVLAAGKLVDGVEVSTHDHSGGANMGVQIDIEDTTTTEMTTTKVLSPDGAGSVQWVASSAGDIEDMSTSELVTTKILKPDGAGGVAWVAGGGGGDNIETFPTSELSTAKYLVPDGAGGVVWDYLDHLVASDGSPDPALSVDATGNVGIGTAAPAGKLEVVGTADDQQLIVKANATQTANIVEIKNSAGTVLDYIDPTGELSVANKIYVRGASSDIKLSLIDNVNADAAATAAMSGFDKDMTSLWTVGNLDNTSNDLQISTDQLNGDILILPNNTGVVKIASTNGSSKLNMYETYTDTTPHTGCTIYQKWSPSGAIGTVYPTAMTLEPRFNCAHTVTGGILTAFRNFAYDEGSTSIPNIWLQDLLFTNSGSGTGQSVTYIYLRAPVVSGAGSIAYATGINIADFSVATVNRGIALSLSAGSNKHNLYISGTAANYLNGNTSIGTTTQTNSKLTIESGIAIKDGITAPATSTGYAQIYVDTADGDLKVKFGDGTVKTLATDT